MPASQWINSSYAASKRGRDLPARSSMRSVRTVDYPGIPEFNDQSGSYYAQTSTHENTRPKGGYSFGTWSGRQAGNSKLSGRKPGKKAKKWYRFGFSKDVVNKSGSGKENNGYHGDTEFSSMTLPLKKSYNDDNYSSLSRRRIKSDGDARDEIDAMDSEGIQIGLG